MSHPSVLHEVRGAHYTVRLVRYAPWTQLPRHAHDDHGWSAVVAGEVVEEAEHRAIVARAGWVVNKPRGVFHANRFGPSGATLVALSFANAPVGPVSRWCWRHEPLALRAALRLFAPEADGDMQTHILEWTTTPALGVADHGLIRKSRERVDAERSVSVTTLARDAGVQAWGRR